MNYGRSYKWFNVTFSLRQLDIGIVLLWHPFNNWFFFSIGLIFGSLSIEIPQPLSRRKIA